LEEVYRDAITGIGRSRRLQADYLSLGREVGNVVDIQERQGRGDGEREDLAGLNGDLVIQVEKAPRQADISDNPMALVQFTTFRVPGLIVDRQRNQETIKAPSFQGGGHTAPKK